MSRGLDSSEQQNPLRRRVQPVDQEAAVEAVVQPTAAAPDVESTVQETMQSSYGNALVQAALKGADIEGLGSVIAGEVAASAAGMGALSEEGGAGLRAAGNDALMRAAARAQRSTFSTEDALTELRGGGGQQLPTGVRQQMERAFGQSFAHVRVHTDTSQAAAALGADAVAMGSHLHFREGAYDPSSTSGRAIIAHELTHVVQAMEGRLPNTGGVSTTSMAAEREAYGNESLAGLSGLGSAELGTLDGSVQMASAVDTSIAPSALAAPSVGGFDGAASASLGTGSFGASMGASLAPVAPAMDAGAMATGPVGAATSATAMLRASDEVDKEESDTEASARHEVAMGLDQGFRRSIDMSQGEHTVNVSKEGTSRKDGVFTEPSASGHLAVDEYNTVMRDIGPDGDSRSSASDENLVDSAENTRTENDGHVHLDDSFKLGATPETPSFRDSPGGDPVLGGSTPGMVSGDDRAGLETTAAQSAPGQGSQAQQGIPDEGPAEQAAVEGAQRGMVAGGYNDRIAAGGQIEGVRFDTPAGLTAKEAAGLYAGIQGPRDLAALAQTHPEQATALQANFVKGAVLSGGARKPSDVLGMVSAIQDPAARARTLADVGELLTGRGDKDSLAMHGELTRLAASDPNLRKALEG